MSFDFTATYKESIRNSLWTVDYGPKQLSEIIDNQSIVETVQNFIGTNHLPNLLLCGPNGCGKTTLTKLLIKSYLGPNYQQYTMEIIGSIYRGKNVVSERNDKKKTNDSSADNPNILSFIKKKMNLNDDKCRIVIIYDFDCMTDEAQMALRRVIEKYAEKVRFIFICNNMNNIIEAIQSRTLILKFQQICLKSIISKLKDITKQKNIILDEEIYETIGIISDCDLKQSINCLQVFCHCEPHEITNFYHIFNIPSIKNITNMIEASIKNDMKTAFQLLKSIIDNGYNVTDILNFIIKILTYNQDIPENIKVKLVGNTINTICINEQVSSFTHLYKLLVQFSLVR